MRRALLALALIVVASSTHLAQQPASTGKPNFVGVWKNVLPATDISGGILTVRISDDAGITTLAATAQCKPLCEWEPVKFWVLLDTARKLPDRGFGTWPDGRFLTFRLDGPELVVELYRAPAKQSERGFPAAHFTVQRFVRGS